MLPCITVCMPQFQAENIIMMIMMWGMDNSHEKRCNCHAHLRTHKSTDLDQN